MQEIINQFKVGSLVSGQIWRSIVPLVAGFFIDFIKKKLKYNNGYGLIIGKFGDFSNVRFKNYEWWKFMLGYLALLSLIRWIWFE